MARRSDIGLWAGAFGASIALHGALAATLALAPRPEHTPPVTTTIAIQSLSSDLPKTVEAMPVPQAATTSRVIDGIAAPETIAPARGGEPIAMADADTLTLQPAQGGAVMGPTQEAEVAATGAEETESIAGVTTDGVAPLAAEPAPSVTPVAALPQTAPAGSGVATALEPTGAATDAAAAVDTSSMRTPVDAAAVGESAAAVAAAGTAARPLQPSRTEVSEAEQALPEIVVPGLTAVGTAVTAAEVAGVASAPTVSSQAAGAVAATASPLALPAAVTTSSAIVPSTGGASASGTPVAPAAPAPASPRIGPPVASRATRAPAVQATRPLAPTAKPPAPAQGPAASETQMAMAPVRPARQNIQARPVIDPLQQVRSVIAQETQEGGCFLALAMPSPQTIDVHGYADMQERLQRLDRDLEVISDASVNTRQHRITAAQCEALSFARALSPDPVAQLPITSDSAEIASGTQLSGAIHHFRRKWLYLVIVDDEGKVQELDDLARLADGAIGFRAPLTLTDGPVDTVQLLLAVASNNQLETFARHEGENARSYFSALASEISSLGSPVDIGIAGFVVR